jgi:hypothetical protein
MDTGHPKRREESACCLFLYEGEYKALQGKWTSARFEDGQTSGLKNEGEIAPHQGKCNYFNTGNNSVQNQGG